MGKHEYPDNSGQFHLWELRLLVEEAAARKIDWGHSWKSLKGCSDEFIFNSLNNEDIFLLSLVHELFIC